MPSCLYGSEPRPGAPNGFWLTLQGVLSFLPSALNGWLAWSPDWLDGLYVSTSDLCAAPQPVVGAFPAADYLACQLSPLTQYGGSCQVVRSWFNAYVRSLLWANQCQCAAAPPARCADNYGRTELTANSGDWAFLVNHQPVESWTSLTAAISIGMVGTGCFDFLQCLVQWWYADGSQTQTIYSAPPFQTTFNSSTEAKPAGAVAFTLGGRNHNSAGCPYTIWAEGNQQGTCTSSPTYLPAPTTPGQPSGIVSLPSGSCSTTADLCAELLRLEQYMSKLSATVQYITRQSVPYSYTLGTPSSGLSGNGYVAVTECMGVLVTLTTIPSTKGRQAGTPTRYFDVGRINWGDVNGYHAHHPIHQSPELILGIPDTATRIGYTFPSGVVATITPVLRV